MKKDSYLSANTIADVSFCEKQLVLNHKYGEQVTDKQQRQRQRGDEEHLRHHLVASKYGSGRGDSHCFIATELYGNVAYETNLLRNYRDTRLVTNWFGKLFIVIYYEVSPLIVTVIKRSTRMKAFTRSLVDFAVKRIES